MARTATKTSTKIKTTIKPAKAAPKTARVAVKTALGEPCFTVQPEPHRRSGALTLALNWFSANCDRSDAKKWMMAWADGVVDSTALKAMNRVHERDYHTSLSWLARLASTGLELTDAEVDRLKAEVDRIVKLAPQPQPDAPKTNVVSIQAIMQERAAACGGEFEGMLDSYLTDGSVQPESVNVVHILQEAKILPQHAKELQARWSNRRDELQAALDGSDAQLKEGYSQFTKSGLKGVIKFCDALVQSIGSYITVKKVSKTPRKRKPTSPIKLVSKLKYMREFKDEAAKLDLKSIQPTELVGCQEAWLYDTAKRKLHHYVADSHIGTMSVKGTTIVGFDAAKSEVKTLRKPGVTLPLILKSGKPATRKVFTDLTTVATQPNGRTNENTILLRVW